MIPRPIIELTEEMVVEPRRRRAAIRQTHGPVFDPEAQTRREQRRRTIMSAILSWLFPLRGVAYDTPLHRLLFLSLRKMPTARRP